MMSETQKNHISEQQMDLVKDLASLIIDTDNLSIAEQAAKTVEAVLNLVGANA
jgi:hypothetical protein